MAKNMTEGKPFKLILTFMIPVLCGGLFQNFYNIADSMIVGRFLGVDALASVGSTTYVNFFVVGWILGITSGFSILIAQSYGAGDEKGLKHYMAMSVYLCVFFAVVMTVGLFFVNERILRAINIPEDIFDMTRGYIGIIYAGLPVTILYNMLAATARALGDSKTPLYFLIISSLLNIVLDILFVAVLPFGVPGAALATVISQGVSAFLCLIYVGKKYEIIRFGRADSKFSMDSIWKLLKMGVPMGLQFSITALGGMLVQSSLNTLGETYIASYTAANKIQNVIMQAYPSLGTAMATYVGQNYGAGKYERIKKGVSTSVLIAGIYSVIIMIAAYFFLAPMVQIFAEDPTGRLQEIAKEMLHICLWFYFPLGLIFIYRNTLQGLGNGLVPMLGGVFELIARAVAVRILFEPFQFAGICMTDPAAWISALIPLIPYYYWYIHRRLKVEPGEKRLEWGNIGDNNKNVKNVIKKKLV